MPSRSKLSAAAALCWCVVNNTDILCHKVEHAVASPNKIVINVARAEHRGFEGLISASLRSCGVISGWLLRGVLS